MSCVFHQWTTEPPPGQGSGFCVLFCVSQANFEATCDDTGGVTIEKTLQDVTSVARSTGGTKPAAAGLPLLHHAEAPGILEKIDFCKF